MPYNKDYNKRKMVYLGMPYTHENEVIRDMRFTAINKIAAEVMLGTYTEGNVVPFSPISCSHPIAIYLPPDTESWAFWQQMDLPFLSRCDELWVIKFQGWQQSEGLKGEIQYALDNNIFIRSFDPWHFNVDDVTY